MKTMANIMLSGKIVKKNEKLYLIATTIFNKKIEILLLEDKNKELTENKLNLKLNQEYDLILKNIIETKDKRLLTIFNDNYELLNKDLFLFNLKIKVIKNGRYISATIKDVYNEEVSNLDLSFSINKNIDNYYINKIIDNFKNENNIFSFGVQEINFIKELQEVDKYNLFNIEDLINIAKKNGYMKLLKNNFPSIKEEITYIKKAQFIDNFLYYKKELSQGNLKVLEDMKKILNENKYKDLPIFINLKLRYSLEDKKNLISFIKREYEKIKFYYSIFHNNLDYNVIEKEVYLNDIILSSNLKGKENFNNIKICNNNKLFLHNVSKFGLTSNVLDQINDFIEGEN